MTKEKIVEVDTIVENKKKLWSEKYDKHRIAYEIYNNALLEKDVSKAITAQCLASMLQYEMLSEQNKKLIPKTSMFDLDMYQKKYDEEVKKKLKKSIGEDNHLKYLVSAIEYAVIRND